LTDVPPPLKTDVVTRSCRIPRVTETTTIRAVSTTAISASASASVNPTYYFTMAAANVGTGFFDQYKIEAIRFNIRSQQNAIGLTTNSTTSLGSLWCVIDYDDASVLTSATQANSYSNVLVLPPGQSCSRIFKPRIAVGAYQGAFTGYANLASQWIDAGSSSVQHYGIKLFIPQQTVGQTQLQTWDIEIEYFISLRKSI